MTNAQYIRSMTDEELAAYIMCPRDLDHDMECPKKTCYECSLAWLKQLYKE